MLIPTSVQQVQTGSNVIHDETLAAPASQFDIQNIPQSYPALLYILTGRSSSVADVDTAIGRFNSDSGANYDRLAMYAKDTTPPDKIGELAQTAFWAAEVGATNAAAGRGGQSVGWIHNYSNTVFFKNVVVTAVITNLSGGSLIEVDELAAQWRSQHGR